MSDFEDRVRSVLGDTMSLPAEFQNWLVQNEAVNGLPSYQPGSEVSYDEVTAQVNITATTAGTANTVIPGTPHTYSGETVLVEFNAYIAGPPPLVGASLTIGLFEGGMLVKVLAQIRSVSTNSGWWPVLAKYRFTPTSGSHTYAIAAWASSATGAFVTDVNGAPCYLRITRV